MDEFWLEDSPQGSFEAFNDFMRGEPGPYFTPRVDANGNLIWTNNGDLPNPKTVNIKGPKGNTGNNGQDGKSAYQAAVEGGYRGSEGSFNDYMANFPAMASAAQTAASQASTAAGQAAASAAHAEELVDTLPDDYEDLLQDTAKTIQAVETKTVGPAAIATFDASAADMPLKGLTVDIEPVQDLHGYDHPWPAGGGKNLLPVTVESKTVNGVTFTVEKDDSGNITSIKASGTATANISSAIKFASVLLPAGTYKANGLDDGGPAPNYRLSVYNQGASQLITNIYQGADNEFTLSEATTVIVYPVILKDTTVSNVVYKPMIRLATEADATFEPYSNICPISGWTGANVSRTGKNLWKQFDSRTINGVTLTVDDDGGCSLTGTATANATFVMPVTILSGSYYLSAHNSDIVGASVRLMLVSNTGGADKQIYLSVANAAAPITLDTEYNQLRIRVNAGVAFTSTKFYPQLELGSTGTAYEPFVANDIYPITFPTEAGTVYGGTLDVVNGVLKVTHAITTVSAKTWRYESNYTRFSAGFAGMVSGKYGVRTVPFMCSAFQPIDDGRSLASVPNNSIYGAGTSATVFIKTDTVSTVEDFISTYGDVQILYELASPINITISPTEITTLFGTNNIWADCGDVTVTYGAYLETVKAYADKVGDSILSAIAPLEMNYTASRAYTVGSFLFVGTKFYKVTAAIASGDTITPDTNVTQTTVAEQLMTLAGN